MEAIMIDLMEKFGYLAITLFLFIESIFPPIPSEVILTFGGFITTITSMNVALVIFFSTLGVLLGAIVLYYLGTIFDEKRLIKIVTSKRFRFLRLKEKDIKKANSWFTKHGPKTVLFGRFIPVIRSLISIPAGMNRMNMKSFLTLTIIGSTIWNTVLVLIGRKVGHEWPKIVAAMDKFSHLVLGIIIVLIVIVIVVFYTVRIRKEKLND